MTDAEAFALPPLTPQDVGMLWTAHEQVVRRLLACHGLTPLGLQSLRQQLRDGTWTHMPPVLEAKRQLLLEDVAHALSSETGIDIAYFIAMNDVPAPAPDTIAELDTT